MRQLLSVFDYPHDSIEKFCEQAERFQQCEIHSGANEFMQRYDWRTSFSHMTLGCIFGEPSIRTRWSFESAMLKMGGNVVSSFGPKSTSAEKGESMFDMLRTASQYVDAIVIRSSEPLSTVADEWSCDFDAVDAHVINAGDGKNEHPTQAMLDAYTIWQVFQQLHSLNFVIVGDMPCSRTIHSLVSLLGTKELNNRFYIWDFRGEGLGQWTPDAETITVKTPEQMKEALRDCDVLYMNRLQKERQSDIHTPLEPMSQAVFGEL